MNYGPDKQRYLLCFSAIREELSREGGCVYIHCKSGEDRSAFTVYSLFRLEYGFSDVAARAALETRLRRVGMASQTSMFDKNAIKLGLRALRRN